MIFFFFYQPRSYATSHIYGYYSCVANIPQLRFLIIFSCHLYSSYFPFDLFIGLRFYVNLCLISIESLPFLHNRINNIPILKNKEYYYFFLILNYQVLSLTLFTCHTQETYTYSAHTRALQCLQTRKTLQENFLRLTVLHSMI